jgi:hypothetical protein
MDEVSNKTLATLLVVAIVISLAGTFFAMRGVSQITNIITGAQAGLSPSGTAKVNISELTQITLVQDTVDFGVGYRNATSVAVGEECNLTTNDTAGSGVACWINLTDYDPDPFLLRNTGNNYVNVTINSSNRSNFLDGTVLGGTRRYQFLAKDSDSVYLAGGENGCNTTFALTDWTEFDETEQLFCSNMSPYDAEDEIVVDINISIPAGPTQDKEATVTFTAEKSAQG